MTEQKFTEWATKQIKDGEITWTNSDVISEGRGWANQELTTPDGSRLPCGWELENGELEPYGTFEVAGMPFAVSDEMRQNWLSTDPKCVYAENSIELDIATIIAEIMPGRDDAEVELDMERN